MHQISVELFPPECAHTCTNIHMSVSGSYALRMCINFGRGPIIIVQHTFSPFSETEDGSPFKAGAKHRTDCSRLHILPSILPPFVIEKEREKKK